MSRRQRRKRRAPGPYYREGRGWYADFRKYTAEGGKREALIPENDTQATHDPEIAAQLYATRLAKLQQLRKQGALSPRRETVGRRLADYADYHLIQKARAGKVGAEWIEKATVMLNRAVRYFGAARRVDTIDVPDVTEWVTALADGRLSDGKRLSCGSQRHHLAALSHLYRRAQSENVVPLGYNPVALMLDKPEGRKVEASWLEVHEAALLLEAARTLEPSRKGGPRSTHALAYPLVATFLLTGGRESEVLGLEVEDVSFGRGTVTFRPNAYRRLKTNKSRRTIPLWPQLREILQPYVDRRVVDRGGTLLFPGEDPTKLITDWRKLLDRVSVRAGFLAPVLDPSTGRQKKTPRGMPVYTGEQIRTKMFRKTYCAARLQTLDRGAPVATYTVSRELGHSDTDMVETVYGRLGTVRHRSDAVEYRVEQHASILGDRLTALARPNRGSLAPSMAPGSKTAGSQKHGRVVQVVATQQVAAPQGD